MARSVAIIGAGQIGFAAANQFEFKGWDVTICARTQPEWLFRGVRFRPYDVTQDTPPNADVVLDTIAFDEEDVARYDPDVVGRLIVVSSASVYCDDQGRTLDEAAQNGFPEFSGDITEKQSTVAPGPATYSTRKMRMEHAAERLFGDRATMLRPCAIHGPWSRHPREWWFVKRMLDGRKRIPLIHSGQSQFQTTNTKTIGYFAEVAADRGRGGAFNLADADSPTVLGIGEVVAHYLEVSPDFELIEGPGLSFVGRTPWSVPKPFTVSWDKACKAGQDDEDIYFTRPEGIEWLGDNPPNDWRTAFPQLAAYPWDLFDYEAEDRFFDERR